MKNANDLNIDCGWFGINFLDISHDGQVFPCCSFTVRYYMNLKSRNRSFLMLEYTKYKDELNIHNHSLEDILNHSWFKETLPNSWENPNTVLSICKKNCTVGHKKVICCTDFRNKH